MRMPQTSNKMPFTDLLTRSRTGGSPDGINCLLTHRPAAARIPAASKSQEPGLTGQMGGNLIKGAKIGKPCGPWLFHFVFSFKSTTFAAHFTF
jgi:hypothetical protein